MLGPEWYLNIIKKVHKKWHDEIDKAHEYSEKKIPKEFLGALLCKESSGEKEAVRNEPHYLWEIQSKKLLNGIDVLIASSSLGACQIMACYSRQYKMLGVLKCAGKTGWIDRDIKDYFEFPCHVAVDHLNFNAKSYIETKNWEAVAKIYNTGGTTKLGDAYWNGVENKSIPAFKKFLQYYPEVFKIPVDSL